LLQLPHTFISSPDAHFFPSLTETGSFPTLRPARPRTAFFLLFSPRYCRKSFGLSPPCRFGMSKKPLLVCFGYDTSFWSCSTHLPIGVPSRLLILLFPPQVLFFLADQIRVKARNIRYPLILFPTPPQRMGIVALVSSDVPRTGLLPFCLRLSVGATPHIPHTPLHTSDRCAFIALRLITLSAFEPCVPVFCFFPPL